ncbi:MAG TPA: HAD family phosphatase, partial [Burkholderiaceae bacterium]|nr:HAD family phosphatase [Burkholderiaceae bacterium]
VDSEPVHTEALIDVLEALRLPVPADLHESLLGLSARQVHQWLVERVGLALPFDGLIARKHAAYRRRSSQLQPRPGSRALFDLLARRGLRQAIVSNSDRVLVDLNLHAIGLAGPDVVSVSRNDVRCGKPDPEPYLRAATLVGAAASACVVVEDSPVGAASGLAAGMRVLVWPNPGDAGAADFPSGVVVVDTIEALAEALAANATNPEEPK